MSSHEIPQSAKAEIGPSETVIVEATPLLTAEQLTAMTMDANEIILITFASGTAPERLLPAIQSKTKSGIPVFLLSNNPANQHGILRIGYDVQDKFAHAGAVALERVNINNVHEVLAAIEEEKLKGARGASLGEAVRKRFEYGEDSQPLAEWDDPEKIPREEARLEEFHRRMGVPKVEEK